MPSITRGIINYLPIPVGTLLEEAAYKLNRQSRGFWVLYLDKAYAPNLYRVYGWYRSLRQAFKYGMVPLFDGTTGAAIPVAPTAFVVFDGQTAARWWKYANLGIPPT